MVNRLRPRVSSRPVSYPENHYSMSPTVVLPYRNPSASFSSPSSGLVGLSTMGPPGITPGPFIRYKPSPDRCVRSVCFSQRSVSDVTHKHSFVCSWWIMSVYKMRLTNASGLQLDVYEHTVSLRKDLVCGRRFPTVWRLITSHQTG